MKNVCPFVVLLIVSLFGACKKVEYQDDLSRSKEFYIAFKAASDNSYKYVVTTNSWTRYRTETTLTIQKGKVVARSFVAVQSADTGYAIVFMKEWAEDAGSLGSHTEGAALQTLDEVYELAAKEWLKKRDNAYVYFEAKNDGMISTAGYAEKNCADDCFNGIEISSIKKL
ncbi:hypothetical protein [Chitinophaga silvisoli]|uniref:hypothetical protein n=1 Tax=Chitinophaga silvisoli TaxID=2291814 RepID=UPI0011C1A319|nr:hypothetical protein [Chitinophaga silvisoli]